MSGKWHGGKGSRQRPRLINKQTFDANWDLIFGGNTMTEQTQEQEECWCERSPSGFCCGWHKLSEEEYAEELAKYNASQG